ncbi:hypothetical protein HZC21_02280 [Candidatus Peregrinibacteria bacterium]|nr:hypothetical protein [Candidatus Peregrinibacteria bacterium]
MATSEFIDKSTGEPVYSLGDRFFVPRDAKLRLAPIRGKTPEKTNLLAGDTMTIRQIDQLSVSQPVRSIRKMIVDLFHPGAPLTQYASCEITPEEMLYFERERRAVGGTRPINSKRVNELINPIGPFPCRASDSPQYVRRLILEAIQKKLKRMGLQLH